MTTGTLLVATNGIVGTVSWRSYAGRSGEFVYPSIIRTSVYLGSKESEIIHHDPWRWRAIAPICGILFPPRSGGRSRISKAPKVKLGMIYTLLIS